MRRIAVIVVLAGFAAWPGEAQSDRVTRGTTIVATDAFAGKRIVTVVHTIRRTNTLLPPYLMRYQLQAPAGTRLDTGRVHRCDLAVLQAKGPRACPRESRVGTGSATGRTILDPGGVGGRIWIFNGRRIGDRRAVFMYVRPERGPAFVNVGKIYGSTRPRIDVLIPVIKVPIGPPDAVISDLVLKFETGFLSAPCPGTYRITSHFMDEPIIATSDRARCPR